ncbi:MAG: NAD-dependent epimerase/dehydratase family protein [Opitutales bacterium]
MNVVVIGGTGLMGPYLLDLLCDAGHDVTCINRRGRAHRGNPISCDRRDPARLNQIFASLNPDVVIDMIPFIRADAEGVVEALGEGGEVKLVAVSSIDVYQAYGRLHRTEPGPYQECPIREEDALRALPSIRQETYDKIGVERCYLDAFENVSILRMPAIYGWPDTSRVSDYLKVSDSPEKRLRIHPDFAKWGFTRASSRDCARAIAMTISLTGHSIYNVGEEDLLSEEAWCREIWNAAGDSGEIVYDENVPIPYNIDTQQSWHVSSEKIRRELCYSEEYSRAEVLRNTIHRIREAGNVGE